MICNPAPEVNCGTVTQDTCVVVTMTDPTSGVTPINWECFLGAGYTNKCWRQSEFNFYIGNKLCVVSAGLLAVQTQLGFTGNLGLSGCTNFVPNNTTVSAEFQALYNSLCTFQYDLNQPINTNPSTGGIDLKCLEDPCGIPIGTLGALLQALVNCCCAGAPSGNT